MTNSATFEKIHAGKNVPKQGKTVQKSAYKGFSGAWMEKELGSVGSSNYGAVAKWWKLYK